MYNRLLLKPQRCSTKLQCIHLCLCMRFCSQIASDLCTILSSHGTPLSPEAASHKLCKAAANARLPSVMAAKTAAQSLGKLIIAPLALWTAASRISDSAGDPNTWLLISKEPQMMMTTAPRTITVASRASCDRQLCMSLGSWSELRSFSCSA